MENIHPRFAYDTKDKRVGAVVTFKDFNRIVDDLENYYDYIDVLKLKSKGPMKTYTQEEVDKILSKKR